MCKVVYIFKFFSWSVSYLACLLDVFHPYIVQVIILFLFALFHLIVKKLFFFSLIVKVSPYIYTIKNKQHVAMEVQINYLSIYLSFYLSMNDRLPYIEYK